MQDQKLVPGADQMTQESSQSLDQATGESPQPAIVSSRLWRHQFGEMLIETREDGAVLIDGKPVADTLPPSPSLEPAAGDTPADTKGTP